MLTGKHGSREDVDSSDYKAQVFLVIHRKKIAKLLAPADNFASASASSRRNSVTKVRIIEYSDDESKEAASPGNLN